MSEVSAAIARVNASIEARVKRSVRNTLVVAYSALVDKSPVDTGKFSSNWALGVGAVNRTTTDATTVPELNIPEIVLGEQYILSNSLEYALDLEHGSSAKAPAGIVAVTAAELQHGAL